MMIPHIDVPVVIWIQGNLSAISLKWYSDFTRQEVDRYTPLSTKLKGNSWHHKYREAQAIAAREQEIFKHCKYFMGRTAWDRRITMTQSNDAQYFH